MRSVWRSDEGTVTAEFALVLPLVVFVLYLALGVLSLVSVNLADGMLVGDLARALSRGATLETLTAEVSRVRPGARLTAVGDAQQTCLTLSEPVPVPVWAVVIPEVVVSTCVPLP